MWYVESSFIWIKNYPDCGHFCILFYNSKIYNYFFNIYLISLLLKQNNYINEFYMWDKSFGQFQDIVVKF